MNKKGLVKIQETIFQIYSKLKEISISDERSRSEVVQQILM